jgi:hypothetical protein
MERAKVSLEEMRSSRRVEQQRLFDEHHRGLRLEHVAVNDVAIDVH